ncbi:MAG: macrolide transporter subunit MacA [Planctomycetaceae bacterium]|nr:macrolide transporter subunit MacA [Planctomycetaceae bacterium]
MWKNLLMVTLLTALSLVWLFRSADRHPSGTKKSAALPAKATIVSESQLNTIELAPAAVKRLGLETVAVQMRSMPRVRPYGGDIVLPTGASVIVAAPLTGTLQLPADRAFPLIGQRVTEKQPLLELLPMLSPERSVLTPAERIRFAEARNTVAQARIDAEGLVQQAQVQVEAAQIALARAERLLRDQAGTIRAVDEAKAQQLLAEKTLQASMTRKKLVDAINLDEAAGTLKPLTIPSPLTGFVRTTQVRAGEMIAAGAPLFEIMNDDVLWVKVPVYVGDVDELDKTQPARLTQLDGLHTAEEVLAQPIDLPPTAVPLASAVDIYYELQNPKREFGPGQRVTAHLTLKGNPEQRVLPWAAVIHDIYGSQWVYEQLAEGKFVRRRVEVGWVRDGWGTLVRGPATGTKLVTAGAAELAGTEFGFAK